MASAAQQPKGGTDAVLALINSGTPRATKANLLKPDRITGGDVGTRNQGALATEAGQGEQVCRINRLAP